MRASNLVFEFNDTFKTHRQQNRHVIKIHKRSIHYTYTIMTSIQLIQSSYVILNAFIMISQFYVQIMRVYTNCEKYCVSKLLVTHYCRAEFIQSINRNFHSNQHEMKKNNMSKAVFFGPFLLPLTPALLPSSRFINTTSL